MRKVFIYVVLCITSILVLDACTINVNPPSHSATPTSTAPSSAPKVDGPTTYPSNEYQGPQSAQEIASNLFDNCTFTTSGDGVKSPIIMQSDDCEVLIEYAGFTGFADAVYQRVLGMKNTSGWFFVNGDTWLVVCQYDADAIKVANNYNLPYVEL